MLFAFRFCCFPYELKSMKGDTLTSPSNRREKERKNERMEEQNEQKMNKIKHITNERTNKHTSVCARGINYMQFDFLGSMRTQRRQKQIESYRIYKTFARAFHTHKHTHNLSLHRKKSINSNRTSAAAAATAVSTKTWRTFGMGDINWMGSLTCWIAHSGSK